MNQGDKISVLKWYGGGIYTLSMEYHTEPICATFATLPTPNTTTATANSRYSISNSKRVANLYL